MKKRILCIVLAALFVASAIFFAVYNKYGNTYNYANHDMSEYVGLAWSKDIIEGLYDGSVEYKTAGEKDIQYAIAKAIAAKNADSYKKSEGTFGLYDTLLANYYMTTIIDGEVVVISDSKKLAPTATTGMQLGADTDFARMIESLLGKTVADNSYVTFTGGKLFDGDILYIDYSVKNGSSVEKSGTYEKFVMEGTDYLESIHAGLTAKFIEKLADVKIGTAVALKVTNAEGAELEVSVTVKYVSRNIIKGAGKVVDGDHVFFNYLEGDATKTTEYNGKVGATEEVTTGEGANATTTTVNSMDKKFGEGFTEALKGLTIGKQGEIKIGSGETEKTYKVTIDYALPVDRTATDREGYKAAENFFQVEYTYPEDSKAQSEIDVTIDGEKKKMDLAGKTVTLYLAVNNFYDMTYDYKGIMDVLGYKPGDKEKVDLYLTANEAFETAKEKYEAAKKKYDDAAALTGDKAKTPEELATLKTAMDDAKTAMDEAQTKLTEAKTAYETELGEGKTTTPDEAAVAAYNVYAEEVAQDGLDAEYSYDVAQIVWDKLMILAKDMECPSKAVKVAYKGLIDSYKATYYKNKTKAPYSDYSTFNSYLKGYLYEGEDYKAAITAEAEEIVRANVVLFRLVEIYEVELTDNQELMVSLYKQIGSDLYSESYEYGAYFDNVMTEIVESINPDLVDEVEDEHAGHDHE